MLLMCQIAYPIVLYSDC